MARLRRGKAYDYRYGTASAANQNVLVPSAAIGTWFVLLYAANVPGASSFSLTATGAGQRVVQVTPAALGNAAPATLRITGAGFEPGTTVTLVGSGNTEYPAASTSVVSYTQLTATFAAGLPPDVYTVRVNQGGNSDSLQNAFTVTAGGSAKLETNLQVPSFLGRHIPATIYITYANAGTVAMPAPLLELVSTDPTQLPLFTLDAAKIIQGLVTNTIPDGYGNTIQILASGEIPGVLLPGESITVPVYYAGLQQPWDFSKNTVSLGLGTIQTTDTTPDRLEQRSRAVCNRRMSPLWPGTRSSPISPPNSARPPDSLWLRWTTMPPISAAWARTSTTLTS